MSPVYWREPKTQHEYAPVENVLDGFIGTFLEKVQDVSGGGYITGIVLAVVLLYKVHQILTADRHAGDLVEEEKNFRQDILKELTEVRSQLTDNEEKWQENAELLAKTESSLRSIRLNLHVFRSVLTTKVDDPKLLALFDNITCFDTVYNSLSLRNVAIDQQIKELSHEPALAKPDPKQNLNGSVNTSKASGTDAEASLPPLPQG